MLNLLKKYFGKSHYIKKLKIYHKELGKFIKETYGLQVIYLENISWGYNTTAFYLKTDQGEFVARLGNYSEDKEENIKKDIYLSNLLSETTPTSKYIKTNDGRYITVFDGNKILRLTKYIQGIPPFDMNIEILKSAVLYLKKIHRCPITKLELLRKNCPNPRLLHGDLTPSNILVSFGKIVGIVDFEMAFVGPIEWDLARCAVFCWYRMHDISFEEALKITAETYNDPDIDTDLLISFAIENAESHLKNILNHESFYENADLWKKDLKIAEAKLEEITHAFRN